MTLLTADDIRYRKFSPTRLRGGYNVDEVDDFLEEVISTVEELTRLAQGTAMNTGSFSAVQPAVANISASPEVANLKSENQRLQSKVTSLEGELANATAAAKSVDEANAEKVATEAKGSEESSEPKFTNEKLLSDNQELVAHLKRAEEEIERLKTEVATKPDQVANLAKIAELQSELDKLQKDYVDVTNQNKDLTAELVALKQASSQKNNSTEADTKEIERLQGELEAVRADLAEANTHVVRLQEQVQTNSEVGTDTGSMSAIGAAAANATGNVNQAAAMLSMAQQLHDEYVQKGKNEAATLVSEAQTKHDELLRQANEVNDKLTSEAKAEADKIYNKLTVDRQNIESKIDQLRIFESDYRKRLKSFLSNLMESVNDSKSDDDGEGAELPEI